MNLKPGLVVGLLAVAGTSWFLRDLHHQRVPAPGDDAWITTDPDTHYQCRRVARVLEEGWPVSAHDPYLDFPHGSAVPWPPYYTAVVAAALMPFAPDDPDARFRWIEMRVASFPLVFGVATSVLVALAAWRLAGTLGAWIAGLMHATSQASIAYSRSGNGDHHAWITMLVAAILLLTTIALRPGGLRHARESLPRGALIGALAGLALGSWVASALYVLVLQLVLGWLVIVHARRPLGGLPMFGLAFHAAALAVVLPAVIASPWKYTHPWRVVNLSWFHVVWLLLGGLVFVPLFRLGGRARRVFPAIVGATLAAIVGLVSIGNTPPGRGVQEAFAWMSRSTEFMASVQESRGLVGAGAVYDPFDVFGYGLALLPIAWWGAAWQAFRGKRRDLLPWAVFVPLLAAQAAGQFRFGDALSAAMAVVVAWVIVAATRSWRRSRPGEIAVPALLVAGTVAAPWDTVTNTANVLARGDGASPTPARPSALAMRGMCGWLRDNSPAPADYSVLASWVWGHVIEWAADRPTVATNFGPFVGAGGFRAPARFLLTEDPLEAEAVLEKRRSRYVLVTTDLAGAVPSLAASLEPGLGARFGEVNGEQFQLRPAWFRTLGARLLTDGYVYSPEHEPSRPLDSLRLVHTSPLLDPRLPMHPDPSPVGWIWERVPGARVEAAGEPGEELEIEIEVRYPHHVLVWADRVATGADGVARMRVPYATVEPNGDGRVTSATWRLGERDGSLSISTASVFGIGVVRP